MKRTPAPGSAKPGSRSVIFELATAAADASDYERVAGLFASIDVASLSAEDAGRWHALLLEAGHVALAAALPKYPDPELPGEGSPEDDFTAFDPGPPETEKPSAVAPALVRAFLRWFGGRADVYARQWFDARRDRSGYWPVREPLTPAVATAHLLGRLTVGQYVLFPDDTVSFAVLDLDPTAEAMEQVRLAEGGASPLAYAPLADYAARLVGAAEESGLRAFAEDSGGFGLHVWLFFAPRVAAATARSLLRELLWRAGPQPPAVAVEIFPKQDRLGGKGLGNLIKLPCGLHQETLRPSAFLGADRQPLAHPEALAAISPCAPEAIEVLLRSRVVPLRPAGTEGEPPVRGREPNAPPVLAPGSPRALALSLAEIEPGAPTKRAVDRIVQGCGVVRELLRRAHEDGGLAPEEARALVYTVGLVGRENGAVVEALAKAGVSVKELERVRRGLQGAAGCRKLRGLVPAACRGCCPEPPPGGYATPVQFAFHSVPDFRRRPEAIPGVDELLGTPTAEAILERIERRLSRIERALADDGSATQADSEAREKP